MSGELVERIARALAPHMEGGREFDQMPKDTPTLKVWHRANMCSFNDATQEDALAAAETAIIPILNAEIAAAVERSAVIAEWRNPGSTEYQRGRSDAAAAIRSQP